MHSSITTKLDCPAVREGTDNRLGIRHIASRAGLAFLLIFLTARNATANQDAKVTGTLTSRVASVRLFKNGFSVITREMTLPSSGRFELSETIRPVHGTLWVGSSSPVEFMTQVRETTQPIKPTGANLFAELVGKRATFHFHGEKRLPITGKILDNANKPVDNSNSDNAVTFVPNRTYGRMPTMLAESALTQPETPPRMLLVETDKGKVLFDANSVAYVEANEFNATSIVSKPVLIANAPAAKAGEKVYFQYLARGLSWAPSYRVDLTADRKLNIKMSTVVRNELTRLKETEIILMSGFPNMPFSGVTSPLVAAQDWNTFFNQLNQADTGSDRSAYQSNMMQNRMMTQQVAFNDANNEPIAQPNATGDSIDLVARSIGSHSLDVLDSMYVDLGQKAGTYEPIVDWEVADNRNEYGQAQQINKSDPWDSIRFTNPFDVPFTTSPVYLTRDGNFIGQCKVGWTNPGEEATIAVNKALSVRVRSLDYEEQTELGKSNREELVIAGRRFYRATAIGELRLANLRKNDIKLQIRRKMTGNFISAEEKPTIVLEDEGIESFNRRNTLRWTIDLKAGEQRTIKFKYSVMVAF